MWKLAVDGDLAEIQALVAADAKATHKKDEVSFQPVINKTVYKWCS